MAVPALDAVRCRVDPAELMGEEVTYSPTASEQLLDLREIRPTAWSMVASLTSLEPEPVRCATLATCLNRDTVNVAETAIG